MTTPKDPTKPRYAPGARKVGRHNAVPGMERAKYRRVGEPAKPWNPEFAASIPWYPKTPEKFAEWVQRKRERMLRLKAEGKLPTRRGVPDGWGGMKKELQAARETAKIEAKEIVTHMRAKNMVPGEDPRAEEALEEMIAIVRARSKDDPDKPVHTTKDRISAAGLVLAYTKQKPATKADVRVSRAEDFLAAVVLDMNGAAPPLIEHEDSD